MIVIVIGEDDRHSTGCDDRDNFYKGLNEVTKKSYKALFVIIETNL